MSEDDFRPAWIDYWKAPDPRSKDWPAFNPTWRKADHAHGIGYLAPWEDPWSGFPEHARRCAIALASTGVPLHLRSQRGGLQMNEADDRETIAAKAALRKALRPLLERSVKYYDAEIFQVVANPQNFFRLAGPTHHWLEPKLHQLALKFRIISTVFERDRLSPSEADCLKRVGQVWVANRKDRVMLLEHGLEEDRVGLVPIPYFPSDPHLALIGKQRLPGVPRFYHIGKWEPRKEQRNIIGAFLCAFEPGEAKLFLKTSLGGPKLKSGYPESPQKAVYDWLRDERVRAKGWTGMEVVDRDIKLLRKRLTARQMIALHRQNDVYVTLSRGEGFDMPAFDAMLSGNPLIYTESGGPQDFARINDFRIEARGSVPCDPFYGWGKAHYIDYAFDEAVDAFRSCHRRIAGADKPIVKQSVPEHVDKAFRAPVVGDAMRTLVERLRERNIADGLALDPDKEEESEDP